MISIVESHYVKAFLALGMQKHMLFRLWLVHWLNNCLDVAEIAYYDM